MKLQMKQKMTKQWSMLLGLDPFKYVKRVDEIGSISTSVSCYKNYPKEWAMGKWGPA